MISSSLAVTPITAPFVSTVFSRHERTTAESLIENR